MLVAKLLITVVDVEVMPPSLDVRSIPTCPITSGWLWLAKIFIISRVCNKEGKRVSNALYTPCEMFSESHVPGIQTLTNENARFKRLIMGLASSVSKRERDSD